MNPSSEIEKDISIGAIGVCLFSLQGTTDTNLFLSGLVLGAIGIILMQWDFAQLGTHIPTSNHPYFLF